LKAPACSRGPYGAILFFRPSSGLISSVSRRFFFFFFFFFFLLRRSSLSSVGLSFWKRSRTPALKRLGPPFFSFERILGRPPLGNVAFSSLFVLAPFQEYNHPPAGATFPVPAPFPEAHTARTAGCSLSCFVGGPFFPGRYLTSGGFSFFPPPMRYERVDPSPDGGGVFLDYLDSFFIRFNVPPLPDLVPNERPVPRFWAASALAVNFFLLPFSSC